MSKEMLDILVDKKKVEEIAKLPTAEEVEKKLKQEGVDVTSEDVKALGNVFNAAANKLDENELNKVGGGFNFKDINWKSPKALKAYKVIGSVAAVAGAAGLAYGADKKFNQGKGFNAVTGWFKKDTNQTQPDTTTPPATPQGTN